MKARLSPTTARGVLNERQKEACAKVVDDLWMKKKQTIVRRFFAAMCLALNDLYGFGDKRLDFVCRGVADIFEDYASRSFTPQEGRNSSIEDGDYDVCYEAMIAELTSRPKIHIERIGDFKR
jgi:hypothetical protein